jgi:elongation factor Ts
MTTTLEMIKQLRAETGAGVMDCRTALENAGADYTLALQALQAKALQAAARRVDHQSSQGRIEVYTHGGGRVGVIVEVNTETDFAGRSEAFRVLSHEIALHIAAAAPLYVRDEDVPAQIVEEESQQAAAKARRAGKAEALIPRIVAGHLEKYKDRAVLMRQPYVRDETLTIAQLLAKTAAGLGENVLIRRFVRWEINPDGEGENRK